MGKAVIIVAGGTGSRMNNSTPKQFLYLAGKPVIVHTINRFLRFDPAITVIIVIPEAQIKRWDQIKEEFLSTTELVTTTGGNNRFESVKKGLACLTDEDVVAIHDGVRPMVTMQTIRFCFEKARERGGAIPVLAVHETLRHQTDGKSITVNRNEYYTVQTPQVFITSMIKAAYEQEYSEDFTDDAVVFESAGNRVTLTEGNRENIKITTPTDLILAEALLKHIF
ncbi:2-C-methyl-D-erythritol 4-phosphate cytidylyltransferase [Kiritimatiella glycovorans]|nr:2-C-methyl-D-erythritol 4-phosphate cytidylyltransferase [Kiritimatiella glycovorans]